ncbi:hypothetical protein F7725_018975, partial [Dissostichus mawsoni]
MLAFWRGHGSWAKDGYSDLGSLSKSAHRHQNASGHLRATIRLKTFGDTRIELQLDEQQCRGVIIHNEKVKRNRGILKRLINCVVVAVPSHDESVTSSNKGNYIELLDLVAEYDSDLHTHLATSKVFTGTSSRIQNDLISAVASVMTDSMKAELRKAPFVAVLDETTDISNVAQIRSAKRTKLLDDICQHRLPRAAPTRWCFHSRLVCTVAEKTRELREVFEHIVDHHTEFDDETVHCSDGYITLLTSFDFSFWLKTFHAIFSYSDVVFQILQNKGFDMQFCLA